MAPHPLADVADEKSTRGGTLSWVGMERIALPFQVAGQPVNGRVSAGVSLDAPSVRGIHMSRLYLALAELQGREVTLSRAAAVLASFLDTHQGLSDAVSRRRSALPCRRRSSASTSRRSPWPTDRT